MNTKDFVYYLVKHGRQLVKHNPHSEFRPGAAILSSLMEFPCNFKDGKCAGRKRSPRCCCINCASCVGHFGNTWPYSLDVLAKYASEFDRENGFWRRGKGCILPRHMRSLTCAYYICEDIRPAFNKSNDKDLQDLRLTVAEYTGCHYRYGGRNGTYHKEILKTETNLNKAVANIMLERKLYYDMFNHKLINVVKREKDEATGWTTLHLEGDSGPVHFSAG